MHLTGTSLKGPPATCQWALIGQGCAAHTGDAGVKHSLWEECAMAGDPMSTHMCLGTGCTSVCAVMVRQADMHAQCWRATLTSVGSTSSGMVPFGRGAPGCSAATSARASSASSRALCCSLSASARAGRLPSLSSNSEHTANQHCSISAGAAGSPHRRQSHVSIPCLHVLLGSSSLHSAVHGLHAGQLAVSPAQCSPLRAQTSLCVYLGLSFFHGCCKADSRGVKDARLFCRGAPLGASCPWHKALSAAET